MLFTRSMLKVPASAEREGFASKAGPEKDEADYPDGTM